MALVQKAFSDIITFSRSSNATRVGPDGLIQYAPHNLLTYSEQFDDASWTKTATTVTANSASAPNGNVTADALVVSTETSAQGISSASFTADGSSSYTSSIYIKKGGNVQVQFNFRAGLASGLTYSALTFNTTTGFVSFSLSSATSGSYTVSESVEWWRIAITAGGIPAGSMRTNVRLTSLPVNTTIYLWGAQLAVGPLALDYTPTTTAAVYGPRFDFDPVTLAARGLLVEEQRTNLLTYSEQFDNAAWTKNATTVTANSVAAPDGTLTADKVVATASTLLHEIYNTFTSVSGTTYVGTYFVKAGEYRFVQLLGPGAVFVEYANFDLVTGTRTAGTAGFGAIQSVGNGWYRISLAMTALSSSATARIALAIVDSGTAVRGPVFTGDGTSGIYAWGAQVEAGAFATSYIPTVASTVTRSADVASVNTLSPWFNATEGTLFAEGSTFGNVSGGLISIEDGTANNRMQARANSSAQGAFVVVASASVDVSIVNGSFPASTTGKLAAAYKVNDFALSVNGASATVDTLGNVPTVNRLNIGFGTSQTILNGHLRRIAVYPRRLTNAEIQALTS